MRLPNRDYSAHRHISFARYTQRRCTIARFRDLAAVLAAANADLLRADGALVQAEFRAQDAAVDREVADEALDELARTIRLRLASRSLQASREAPYLSVFSQGIAYYVEATVEDEITRYRELAERLEKYLPAADPLRAEIPRIAALVAAWAVARDGGDAARRAVGIARTVRSKALAAWEDAVNQVYGALIQRVGKAKAERFFTRGRRKKDSPG